MVLGILMVAAVEHGQSLVTFAGTQGGARVRAVLSGQALSLSRADW